MPADLQAVRDILISVAEDSVGDLLSTIPGPGNTTFPAVVKSRKKFTENTPPFVVLDQGARKRQGLNTIRQQLVTGDFTEYETHYDYLFSYTAIGGDALEIAGRLETAFSYESTRISLEDGNIFLVDTQDVIPSSDIFNGEYVEVATFNIIVTIPEVNERDEGCFDSMSISGEIYEDISDPDPFTFNIEV